MIDYGTVRPCSTLYIPFQTFDSNDPTASVTMTGLALADIKVYKDGGTTERASTAGFTLLDTDGTDFDSLTGLHGISIDLGDNTTANFYEAGSQYWVGISDVTVDGGTVRFWIARFVIGYEDAVLNTTIATLSSQTSFTLEDGPTDDDALNGFSIIVHDLTADYQIAHGVVSDYVGSTKTITLAADPGIFLMAAGDNISFFVPALQPVVPGNRLDVTATGAAGIDWGNVENASTTVDLSATSINLCDTTTTNTDMRGTDNALLAASAPTNFGDLSITASTGRVIVHENFDKTDYSIAGTKTTLDALNDVSLIAIETTMDTALTDIGLHYLVNTALPSGWATIAPNSALDHMADDGTATFDRTTDSMQALRDHIGDGTNLTEAGGTGDHFIGLPDVTVGSINAGAITAASIDADAITSAKIATDAIGAAELAADAVTEIAAGVWNRDIADSTAAGTFGEAMYLNAYAGPRGPGVYFDDGAANTGTVAGEDGTPGKPVSGMASAKVIADAIGVSRYYFKGCLAGTAIDQTLTGWHFVGLEDLSSNIIDLNNNDVSNSLFENLTLQGPQGGSGRATAINCVLRDDPVGSTTLHIHAINCGLPSADPGILLTNNDDHIFEGCYSMVDGNGTPMIDANSGANVGLNIRHYSGGIELKGLSATSSTSIESAGQVVFNATNTTTAEVVLRGNMTITDNASMTNVTDAAVYNTTQVNAQVDDVLNTDAHAEPTGVPAANESLGTKLGYLFMALRNRVDVTATKKTFYDDAGTGEWEKDLSDDGTTYSESEGNAI